MKTLRPTPAHSPQKTTNPDPVKRLSLAVKKLDQLIDRAQQLSSLTDHFIREDSTGPRFFSSSTNPPQPLLSHSSQKNSTAPSLPKITKES